MPINTREARQLSTASEWTLIESSLRTGVGALSDAQLKRSVVRARTLRDKYRDLSMRQHRQTQPRRLGRPADDLNVRTKRKTELFAEVLERFTVETRRRGEKASATRAAEATRTRATAAKKTKKVKKAKGRGKGAAAVQKQPPSPTPAPAKVKRTLAPLVPKAAVIAVRTGQHRKHAHASSATRRTQGKRDRR